VAGEVEFLEPAGAQDPGVVDEDVEVAAGGLGELFDASGHLVAVGDVEVTGDHGGLHPVEFFGEGLQPDFVDVERADGVALTGEGDRGLTTDTGGGAGDEHGSEGAHKTWSPIAEVHKRGTVACDAGAGYDVGIQPGQICDERTGLRSRK
jgi:hypothetical protein